MWFDNEELLGRRLSLKKKRRKKKSLLNVKLNAKDKAAGQRVGVVALAVFVLVAVVVIGWWVSAAAGKWLVTENDLFKLKTLVIDVDERGVVKRELVRELSGIEAGQNIFQVDMRRIRSEFLSDMHNVKEMEIVRQLPDTIKIRIVERDPIARIGRKGGKVLDADGWVFAKPSDLGKYPVIYGYQGPRLQPGDRVRGLAFAAIQLLDACSDPAFSAVAVKAIDVSNEGHLVVWLKDGSSGELLWDGMGATSRKSQQALIQKLRRISRVLEHDRGRNLKKYDWRYDNPIGAPS